MSIRAIVRAACFGTIMIAAGVSNAVAQSADLTVSKTGPSSANANTDVAYTITVTNLGPDPSSTVTLTDVVTGGWSFVSVIQNSGPSFLCSDPGAGATSGSVVCTVATLTAGSSATFTIVFHIPLTIPPGTDFTNVATASSSTDPNDENNSSTAVTSTPPPPQADLGVTKNGPPSASPNSDVTYTITLTNSGPDAASNVSLTDTLMGTMTFVSFLQNTGPTMSCSTGTTTTCTLATFPAGATAVFTLVGHIPPGTPSGTPFTNTVTVTSSTSDPNASNGSSGTLLTVRSADLSVTKTGPATATAGTNVTYTITVANGGADFADNVALSDTLPPGSTYVSLTQNTGPSAVCSTPSPGTGGTVTCNFGSLNNGESAQFTLVTVIGSGPTVNNTASVSGDTGDPSGANNSATATTTVTTIADLSVSKSGPATAAAGSNITYTVTIVNSGPSPALNATLTDTVPGSTTFVSVNQTSGPAFSCTAPSAGGTGTISCSNPSFGSGGTAVFSMVVKVDPPTTPGTVVTNTASATPLATDPNSANNSATATTITTAAPADIRVVKTAPPGLYATGFPIAWNIVVSNNGSVIAFSVTMTDVLPAGVTFVSATPSQGSCSGTTTVVCTLGTLAPFASATVTLNATLPPTPGPVSNTAMVSTTSPDTNPANNSSTSTVTVLDAARIPALSPLALALLALGIAALALLALRR